MPAATPITNAAKKLTRALKPLKFAEPVSHVYLPTEYAWETHRQYLEKYVKKPNPEHPKREVVGFECERSEVSGRRLWGLFSEKFPKAEDFFRDHFVVNYCPLVWMGETGKNITPDKLPKVEMEPVEKACRQHLATVIAAQEPEWLIGVGAYAEKKLIETVREYFPDQEFKTGKILHPSPASPAANRGWEPQAEKQLLEMGVWS